MFAFAFTAYSTVYQISNSLSNSFFVTRWHHAREFTTPFDVSRCSANIKLVNQTICFISYELLLLHTTILLVKSFSSRTATSSCGYVMCFMELGYLIHLHTRAVLQLCYLCLVDMVRIVQTFSNFANLFANYLTINKNPLISQRVLNLSSLKTFKNPNLRCLPQSHYYQTQAQNYTATNSWHQVLLLSVYVIVAFCPLIKCERLFARVYYLVRKFRLSKLFTKFFLLDGSQYVFGWCQQTLHAIEVDWQRIIQLHDNAVACGDVSHLWANVSYHEDFCIAHRHAIENDACCGGRACFLFFTNEDELALWNNLRHSLHQCNASC